MSNSMIADQWRIQRLGKGGPRNMKSMRLPLAAIFFMTYFHRAGGGGGMAPLPLDPLLLIKDGHHWSPAPTVTGIFSLFKFSNAQFHSTMTFYGMILPVLQHMIFQEITLEKIYDFL